jgi:Zn ribbon nucleic-acid-binding protein
MGAPCPHCHCQALVTYGGDDHVTCQECKAIIGPQEYAIWVAAVLEDLRQKAA